jgi:hypothetical protein
MKISSIFLILTILLVFLKVGGFISISWLWCFSLIWVPFGLVMSLMALSAIVIMLSVIVKIINKVLER